MFEERYRGLRIAVSHAAMRELVKHGWTLSDVVGILERGHDAPRKRAAGTIEKWLNKGAKTCNVVIGESYDEIMREPCWVLIHAGQFTRRKTP